MLLRFPGGVRVGDGAIVVADQPTVVNASSTVPGGVGVGDGATVGVDQSAASAVVIATTAAVPGGISIGNIAVVCAGKGAIEDSDVGDGRRGV